MSETEGNPAKPPRFPYVAALLCAACVGMAGYLWMRYSYAWTTTAEDLNRDCIALIQGETAMQGHRRGGRRDLRWIATLPQPYLAVHGRLIKSAVGEDGLVYGTFGFDYLRVILPADAAEPDSGVERAYVGRLRYEVVWRFVYVELDTTASRFTGATIAGLVVGAMGVLVFTVALRHWLKERRALTADAARP